MISCQSTIVEESLGAEADVLTTAEHEPNDAANGQLLGFDTHDAGALEIAVHSCSEGKKIRYKYGNNLRFKHYSYGVS